MKGTNALPKTRKLGHFGQLTAAQTHVVRLCWSNGTVDGEKFNPTGADVTIRSLMRRGILTQLAGSDEYLLTDDAARCCAYFTFYRNEAF